MKNPMDGMTYAQKQEWMKKTMERIRKNSTQRFPYGQKEMEKEWEMEDEKYGKLNAPVVFG